jgi:hypothetical protein
MGQKRCMTLAEYLDRENLKPSAFAARLGFPASTITRLLRGERRPHLRTAHAIMLATNGAVTFGDFFAASDQPSASSPAVPPSPVPEAETAR